jgi:type IV pilus assembly protein PilB
MGVPPYVITSTINLIVAQRLVGKICDVCKSPHQVPKKVLLDLGVDENEVDQYKVFQGRGCNNCNGTGIRGRIAIFELMSMSEPIKEAILRGASSNELRNIAKKEGMRTLRRSALLKLKRGQTTIQEVINSSVRDT